MLWPRLDSVDSFCGSSPSHAFLLSNVPGRDAVPSRNDCLGIFVEHATEPCTYDLTHQADNKTSLCNADGTRPVVITRTYNYRCVDSPNSLYCRQGWAFDPASLYGHVAWEKLEECYVSLGTYSTHRTRQLITLRSFLYMYGCLDRRTRLPCFPTPGEQVADAQRLGLSRHNYQIKRINTQDMHLTTNPVSSNGEDEACQSFFTHFQDYFRRFGVRG